MVSESADRMPFSKDGPVDSFSNRDMIRVELSISEIDKFVNDYRRTLKEMAPDVDTNGLAEHYAVTLFDYLIGHGAKSREELIYDGGSLFRRLGREVYGPIAVAFLDTVMKGTKEEDILLCPQRDGNIFYFIAMKLKELAPETYPINPNNILNPVINRKTWGTEDDQNKGNLLGLDNPLVKDYLSDLGFGTKAKKMIVDVGAWGSLADACKRHIPNENIEIYYMFSHMPDRIYGFINNHADGLADDVLEMIGDTFEGFPKSYRRPETLQRSESGKVTPLHDNLIIDSPFLGHWESMALLGVKEAAREFIMLKKHQADREELDRSISAELKRLSALSDKAREEFTGMLIWHTETWEEGEKWKNDWCWGCIPPLRKGG